MRVAIDATPLIAPGTGVGTFVRGALGALSTLAADGTGLDLSAWALSLRGGRGLDAALPPGVRAVRRPMAAGPLLRLWARFDHPCAERWTGRVDVVHGTNFVVPPTDRAAAVVTVHDLTALRFPDMVTAVTRRYPDLIRRAVDRGAWVHTPSQAMAADVVELLGVPPARVRAVHHGVDTVGGGDAAAGRAMAGVDRYVLALGTVEPRKGLPDLVAAFDRIAGDRPDLHLVVAGPDGWGSGRYHEAVAVARHGDRVRRLGWVAPDQRADLLAGAAVLAYPSVYEGFGLPPLEAMSAAVPVVASRAGALAEVLGDAACLVDVGDVGGLAAALAAVVDDPSLSADLARRGPAHAARFTWAACAAGLVDLYRTALGSR